MRLFLPIRPARAAALLLCLALPQLSPTTVAQNLTASPELTLALIYQLTPLSIPIAFATARSFRERNLATRVSVDATGRTLTLNSFLDYASAQYSPDKSSEIST